MARAFERKRKPMIARKTSHQAIGNTHLGRLGLLLALPLLALLCFGTIQLTTFLLPETPRWVALLFGALLVSVVTFLAQQRFVVLQNWTYLLPAIIFLLAFTIYPLGMTLYYAFTNYSAVTSGRPDSSTQMQIKRLSANQIQITDATDLTRLRCEKPDCALEMLELRNEKTTLNTSVIQAKGTVVSLSSAMPEDFIPTVVRRVSVVRWIGLDNFADIFANATKQLIPVFSWNLLFALLTTVFNVTAGIVLGVMLHNKQLKFRNFYRSILFLPWAIPGVISIQMWQALFNTNFGAMNRLLGLFGLAPAPWLEDPLWAKAAILLVNLWLSFPYFMTATLGALSTIPEELYEAAEVDGATPWQRFRFITLPLLQMPFTPIVVSSFAASFNNVNLIILLTNGGPVQEGRLPTAQSTDILMSWGYKTAFQSGSGQQFGLASAIAVVVGLITIAISIFNFRFAGAFNEPQSQPRPASSLPQWLTPLLGWFSGLALLGLLVWSGLRLSATVKPRSFAVLYPANAAQMVLLGLTLLALGLVLLTYLSHLWALRSGRNSSFLTTLNTLFTHGFFWVVMIGTIYPIIYVFSASFDPLNRLTQASLGDETESLLTRARVLPSLDGLNFNNYLKLIDGVIILPWQWALLAISLLAALLWGITQLVNTRVAQTWGVMTQPKINQSAAWVALLSLAVLVLSFSAEQFTSANPSSKFLLWVRNTLLISGSTGLITMALTTTAGYAMARLQFSGRLAFLKTIIFLQMFPSALGLVAVYGLINYLGLVNTFPGLILAYSGGVISFGIWVFKAYFETIPPSLDEAALVDGCTRWQAFVRIVLPLSTPVLTFIFLLQFIGTYTEFFLANVLLTGAENWNIGVGLRSFTSGQFTTSYGPFAAAAVLGAIPIVVLFYAFQRVFVSGMQSGGVKG